MKLPTIVFRAAATLASVNVAIAQNMGFGGQIMNQEDFMKFDSMSELERLVALTKNQWPECLHGDANECENLIKAELDSMDLSFPVQTVIIYTRNKNSPTAHAWVVPIDDNGMCIGKHKDGRIFYEYDWCVDEEEPLTDEVAIKESKKLIKPSKWAKIACERKQDLECDYDEPNEPGTGGNDNGDSGDDTDNETDTVTNTEASGDGSEGDNNGEGDDSNDNESDNETEASGDESEGDNNEGGDDSNDNESDNETDNETDTATVTEASDDGSEGNNNGGGNNNNNGINGDGNPNSSIEINNGNGGSGENNGSQGTGNPNSSGGDDSSDNGGGNSNNNNNNGINGDGNPNSSIEINNGNEGSGENNGSQGTGNPNSNSGGNNGQGKNKRRLYSQVEYVSGLKEWRRNILNDVGVGGDFEPACSTNEGIQKILEVRANGPIVNQGCQKLPAINCLGLSGIDTCKMIKEMVPYPNNKGKNMECFLQYLPNSPKRGEIQRDLVDAGHNTKDKVIIYAVYETNKVIATPQMNGPNAAIGSV